MRSVYARVPMILHQRFTISECPHPILGRTAIRRLQALYRITALASMGGAPPPSPFANEPRQTPEASQHSNSYPPPSRENTYASEIPYGSRAGSISAPTRSPDGNAPAHLQHVNGTHPDGPYQSLQGPPEYRSRGGYVPPDIPPNGSHPAALHIATTQEVMPGHQPIPSNSTRALFTSSISGACSRTEPNIRAVLSRPALE